MNNRLLVPQKLPLLLDYAPGAAAAYSLRSLSNSYVGPVVTVRRSTDSAERDFTATEVSDGTLAAWCGGGDGFVKQWWSQTGSNHASNSTAAQQPKLVSAGVVILEGGNPAVLFDGSDDRLKSAFALSNRLCLFGVARMDAANDMVFDGYGPTPNACSIWAYSDTQLRFFFAYGASIRVRYRPFSLGSQFAFSLTNTSDAVSEAYVNGSNAETLTGASGGSAVAMNGITLGCSAADNLPMLGTISEIIVYEADMTALRTRIEGDLAWYY